MTAPRPFAEVVEELRRLHTEHSLSVVTFERKDAEKGVALVTVWRALPLLLSRLASREAVFEAAVANVAAWDSSDMVYLQDMSEEEQVETLQNARDSFAALRAALSAARALDAAAPQGEEA